jgi:hypothetical protein
VGPTTRATSSSSSSDRKSHRRHAEPQFPPSSILFNPCPFRALAMPISSAASSSPFSPSRSRFKLPQAARIPHRSPRNPPLFFADFGQAKVHRRPVLALPFSPPSGAPPDIFPLLNNVVNRCRRSTPKAPTTRTSSGRSFPSLLEAINLADHAPKLPSPV